jgi:hypothetical protein
VFLWENPQRAGNCATAKYNEENALIALPFLYFRQHAHPSDSFIATRFIYIFVLKMEIA